MTRALFKTLKPSEEIALRRVAHGSIVIDARAACRLQALTLIESKSGGLRLTPLGRLRFNALAKAPLLAAVRSTATLADYIEGLLAKAHAQQLEASPISASGGQDHGAVAPEAPIAPQPGEPRDAHDLH
jgi:hypothetical protein